ncbi:hypothetical protein AN403_3159 [Pseudomonas fluorescens]|uniref:Uncharacterized protein n=1 Tax=Pseudomonas fluorescens TaxID=294 RepID=A0A0P8Z3W8_PSEFL|nr:hypothetical protein AN403_3159 [Pseudomonas fluorescens]
MLAMVVNDDAGYLNARIIPTLFASMLAPTGGSRKLWKTIFPSSRSAT